ncbi:hypothetical protein PMAYCL1PPCAC_10349, partial [Pristionchus mayeri]
AEFILEFSVPIVLVMGFLFGLLDSCNNTSRTVMCATALPAKQTQVFAVARFYQALAGSILLFCSPLLTTYLMLGIEAILFLIGAGFFLRVVALLNQRRRDSKSDLTDDNSSVESFESAKVDIDGNGNDLRL